MCFLCFLLFCSLNLFPFLNSPVFFLTFLHFILCHISSIAWLVYILAPLIPSFSVISSAFTVLPIILLFPPSLPPFTPHSGHTWGIKLIVPECFSDHIFICDAVVGQGLTPHRVECVVKRLGSKFIGLKEKWRSWLLNRTEYYDWVTPGSILQLRRAHPSGVTFIEMLPELYKHPWKRTKPLCTGENLSMNCCLVAQIQTQAHYYALNTAQEI